MLLQEGALILEMDPSLSLCLCYAVIRIPYPGGKIPKAIRIVCCKKDPIYWSRDSKLEPCVFYAARSSLNMRLCIHQGAAQIHPSPSLIGGLSCHVPFAGEGPLVGGELLSAHTRTVLSLEAVAIRW